MLFCALLDVVSMSNTGSGVSPSLNYFCIDVECIAIGCGHNDRAVGQIALVDEQERVLLDIYVKPEKPVVSYLTPLSGLTKEKLEEHGVPLETALKKLKELLPSSAILVGQNIKQDVMWCKLEEGVDFLSMINLAELYKVYRRRSWIYFSLRHVSNAVLGIPLTDDAHNAVEDAVNTIRLYRFYLRNNSKSQEWNKTQRKLLTSRGPMSFSKRHPRFEGVCMGNKAVCNCGQPFTWF